MKWTNSADIRAELERRWKRGEMCRARVGEEGLFPLSLSFKKPSAKTMLNEFSNLQDWVKIITHFARQHDLQLQWHDVNHRSLGRQQLPAALLLSTPEQAAALIGKRQALKQFVQLYKTTSQRCPELQPWLLKRPLKALSLGLVWTRLVDLCLWIQAHPRPGIYLRQVSLSGIDSKFIESHRGVLAELFDLVLPRFAIDDDFSGVAGFAHRYGFLDKPLMLRMRPLDKAIKLLPCEAQHDVMLTAKAFAHLHHDIQAQVEVVFIVENEINYLSFPDMPNALLIFGSGYGFDALKSAGWIKRCALYYWGDLDTHGFAILNQLRASFPQVQSFLMDRKTLLKHQSAWGREPKQETKDLLNLTPDEAALYDELRRNKLSERIRLEQESIDFMYAKKYILSTEASAGTPCAR